MKKLLSFRGPAHHGQLLRPVEDALTRRGWQVTRYTADTEGCFQVGLNEELGINGYEWLPDYAHDGHAIVKSHYAEAAKYFQEIYSQLNGMSLMIPQIADRIIHAICREWVATEALFAKVKPDACVVLHELNRWGMMLAYLAHRKGVPVYSFQEGLYYGDSWLYTGHTRFSTSLVWGEATKNKLLAAGCDEGRIRVVGHPDLGRRYEKAAATKSELWAELPEEMKGRKLCLVFFTNVETTEEAEKVMVGIPEQEEWGFVARMHQLASAPYIEKVRRLFQRRGTWFSDNLHTFGHHWQLMSLCDALIVVGCSSTFLEWAASGKPMGQVRSNLMFRDFAKEGIAVDAFGLSLLHAVQKVMKEWNASRGDGALCISATAAQFAANEIEKMDAAEDMADIVEGKQ